MKGVTLLISGRYQARYYAGRSFAGRRVYASRTFATETEAGEWYTERKRDRECEPEPPPRTQSAFPEGWAKKSYASIRGAAKYRKIAFEISFQQYEELLAQAKGRCTLTGIPFEFSAPTAPRRRRPFAPSLDRIDSTVGYTPTNCRLVCCAVNFALGDWGMETLMRVARNLVARERDVMEREWLHRQRKPTAHVPFAHQNAQNGSKAQQI